MPSLLPYPALAPHDGRSGSAASSHASEAFYTNEEISIIHDIVVAAQSHLDSLPEIEQLPTNALFQAYDAILPTYGLDPEEDQHLSKLVFRIGGERADGALLDKFRAVMDRMGIQLEFDASTIASGSSPAHPGEAFPFPPRPLEFRPAGRRRSDSDTGIASSTLGSGSEGSRPSHTRSHSTTGYIESTVEQPDTARLTLKEHPWHIQPHSIAQHQDTFTDTTPYAGRLPAEPRDVAESSLPANETIIPAPQHPDSEDLPETPSDESSLDERARQYDEYRIAVLGLDLFNLWLDVAKASTTPEAPTGPGPGDDGDVFDDADRSLEERSRLYQEYRLASFGVKLFDFWKDAATSWEFPLVSSAETLELQTVKTIFTNWKEFAQWQEQAAEDAIRKVTEARHSVDAYFDSWFQFAQWREGAEEEVARQVNEKTDTLRETLAASWSHFAQWKSEVEDMASSRQESRRLNMTAGVFATWIQFARWKGRVVEEALRREAHYRRCERLAARARQIYLVTSCFSLWERHAKDRADRTAVARRHILRLRHFEAWKEVALGEDRVIRAFVQGIWLPRWVEHHRFQEDEEAHAADTYRQTLLSKTFLTWRISAFEQTSQLRRSEREKESAFHDWLRLASDAAERDAYAQYSYEQTTLTKDIGGWWARSSRLDTLARAGASQYQETSLHSHFQLWRAIAREHLSKEATYKANVTIKTFNAWCLEARIRRLETRRNCHLLSETFSCWLTHQKVLDLQARRDHALKEDIFEGFQHRSRELEARSASGEIRRSSFYVAHASVAQMFSTWNRTTSEADRARHAAADRHSVAARVEHLNGWYETVMHNAEMERWAQRGQCYLAVTANFDPWKDFAKAEKNRKLRAAYTQGRDGANRRLFMSCWQGWRQKCASESALQRRADVRFQSREDAVLADLMERWRSSVRYREGLDHRSAGLFSESLFDEWLRVAGECAVADLDASQLWVERKVEACWGRWSLALQRSEGQAYNAENALERRARETTVRIFLSWRYGGDGGDGGGEVADFRRSDMGVVGGHRYTPARFQPWSRSNILDYNARAGTSRAPGAQETEGEGLGTLNTPTRWTGLPRSLAGLASTTPLGPLPTPHERLLRAQYGIASEPIREQEEFSGEDVEG